MSSLSTKCDKVVGAIANDEFFRNKYPRSSLHKDNLSKLFSELKNVMVKEYGFDGSTPNLSGKKSFEDMTQYEQLLYNICEDVYKKNQGSER